jgi:hypothetical protein
MSTIEKILPELIRIDGDTQPRAKLSREIYEEYAEQMKAGEQFPPITVYFDGKNYWLADGFHRINAHVIAWPDELIECEVLKGTKSDAQWHSYGANITHGLRRTNEDKLRAIKAALQHPQGSVLSDRHIAEHIGVHHSTISKLRKELSPSVDYPQKEKRIGRDGRKFSTKSSGNTAGTQKSGKPSNSGFKNSRPLRCGHSKACPMIPLQFSPNNPQTAAATIIQKFSREFIVTLVHELNQRLQQSQEKGQST